MQNIQAALAYQSLGQRRTNKKAPLVERTLLYMLKYGELQWEQGIGGQWIAHSKRVEP